MTNPTEQDIKKDIGEAYNSIEGTTVMVVENLIDRAQKRVRAITGTTTGNSHDLAIRSFADVYTLQHVLAGLGPDTVGQDHLMQMRDFFKEEATQALKVIGKSMDGDHFHIAKAND